MIHLYIAKLMDLMYDLTMITHTCDIIIVLEPLVDYY